MLFSALARLTSFDELATTALLTGGGVSAHVTLLQSSEETTQEKILDLLLKLGSIDDFRSCLSQPDLALRFVGIVRLLETKSDHLRGQILTLLLMIVDDTHIKIAFSESCSSGSSLSDLVFHLRLFFWRK